MPPSEAVVLEQSRDEVGELRAALLVGDWIRLTDPLLPFVLLDNPGEWWTRARSMCANALVGNLPRGPYDREGRWISVATEMSGRFPFDHPRRVRMRVLWARDRLRHAPSLPLAADAHLALAVLEQFTSAPSGGT